MIIKYNVTITLDEAGSTKSELDSFVAQVCNVVRESVALGDGAAKFVSAQRVELVVDGVSLLDITAHAIPTESTK
jgi:hypothetical protein